VESQINDLKAEKYELLTTPCSVFMTFENEEGITRALKYDEAIQADPSLADIALWMEEFKIEIQPASEPSDIIWENRHFSNWDRLKKEIVVFLILLVLLAGSFLLIFICSLYSTNLLAKYPATDCSTLAGADDSTNLQTLAYLEWNSNVAAEEKGLHPTYAGYVQCFCNAMKDAGNASTELYTNPLRTASEADPVCENYISSIWTTMIASNAVTGIIVVINLILKTVTISLITWIGYDTHSEMMTKITNGVFISLFFNTAILITLVYANLGEVGGPLLSSVFSGPFYDYSPGWYNLVGATLVSTMLLNAFMPPVYELMTIVQCWLFKRMDQSWEKDKN